MDPSFRTKSGTCTITPERIVLTREDVPGAVTQYLFGDVIEQPVVLYRFVGVLQIAVGLLMMYLDGGTTGLVFVLTGMVFLVIPVADYFSATPVIERASVRRVEAWRPIPGLRRGCFVVVYEENGEERRGLIMLSSAERAEYDTARGILADAGLLAKG